MFEKIFNLDKETIKMFNSLGAALIIIGLILMVAQATNQVLTETNEMFNDIYENSSIFQESVGIDGNNETYQVIERRIEQFKMSITTILVAVYAALLMILIGLKIIAKLKISYGGIALLGFVGEVMFLSAFITSFSVPYLNIGTIIFWLLGFMALILSLTNLVLEKMRESDTKHISE